MPGSVFAHGDTVDLRTIEEADLDVLRDAVNDPRVRTTIGMRTPKNTAQEREWLEEYVTDEDHVDLAIAADGETVGVVGLGPTDHPAGSAELGIWVAPEHWGNGYATDAARTMTDYAFDTLRKHRVTARVFDGNDASRRVWEKLGYTHEAVHRDAHFHSGDYVDVHYYAVLEDEWRSRSPGSTDG
ncbi:GNAT family N-acetyltransferase [Halocalculus aciditolerans]|uniref:N-acetyltransferase n=1 Tax=Halocalculus aciditolerans TaxID=1383812 RepID=A0A830F7W0_9EURY|nr:GNAT family protein [Halocalculus aciditolerans]GGL48593.1 N-acetyltransferase [Halocalculus aciditolerans]